MSRRRFLPHVERARAVRSNHPSPVAVALMGLALSVGGVALVALAFQMRHAVYAALDYAAFVAAVWFVVLS